jgi:hypothetical protein
LDVLGGNEFRLRQGFASGKTLATGDPARAAFGGEERMSTATSFFLGFALRRLNMLGGNEFRLRQGFACGKTLATGDPARAAVWGAKDEHSARFIFWGGPSEI